MSAEIKALHNIVLSLTAAERRRLSPEIALLQACLKDTTDLISPRSGRHFLLRLVEIKTDDHEHLGTFNRIEAAQFLNTTTAELALRLTRGKGSCQYQKLNKKKFSYETYLVNAI